MAHIIDFNIDTCHYSINLDEMWQLPSDHVRKVFRAILREQPPGIQKYIDQVIPSLVSNAKTAVTKAEAGYDLRYKPIRRRDYESAWAEKIARDLNYTLQSARATARAKYKRILKLREIWKQLNNQN